MERKKHSGTRPSPPKQSPDKVKNASEGLMGRFPAPATFSFKAFLRSFFACSGSGVECGDDPPIYQENIIKKPVISPTRPLDTKKQRRSKHSVPTTPQVQHESVIALSTSLNKLEANDNLKERPVVANDSPDSNKKNSDTPLPNISEPSTVLSESLRSSLCTYLPTLVQGRDWVLLYSTWKHGISLRTLYRRSAHLSGPCLLAIEDSKGAVFGGLLTAPLNPTAKPKFQGTHQSFVFTNVTTDLAVFRATGSNRYYFLCTKDMLVLGGGGTFALRLDGDLSGDLLILRSMFLSKLVIALQGKHLQLLEFDVYIQNYGSSALVRSGTKADECLPILVNTPLLIDGAYVSKETAVKKQHLMVLLHKIIYHSEKGKTSGKSILLVVESLRCFFFVDSAFQAHCGIVKGLRIVEQAQAELREPLQLQCGSIELYS